ncbi:MAG TPA: 50S ribosomal protein L24 [Candidatus Paceibacterota bacterium]
MKIKKGDNIIVISGKDRGKTGKITKALPKEDRVVIEGVNIKKKHSRPRKGNQKGQIIEFAAPIHVSNVQLLDPKSGKGTRVGFSLEKGKKVRIAKKSKTVI